MIRAATLLTLALASPAGAFELAWPAACTPGETCHVQNYFDHDATTAFGDFTCGPLGYDGHDGTDIALPDRAAMEAGVQVLAAAAGTVKGMRDGVADFVPTEPDRECGNGVLISHPDGWETQYCHMKQGSVLVQPGDQVALGQPLGLIGQSGMAEFPHLHITVRHDGAELDPFAPDTPTTCATAPPAAGDLWSSRVAYEPGGLLSAGFSAAVPEYDAIRMGLATTPLPATAPGLVLWAYAFGTRIGDTMTFHITGPDGEFLTQDFTIDRTQAQMFRATGRRLTTPAWPAGTYSGTITLTRDSNQLDQITTEVQVNP